MQDYVKSHSAYIPTWLCCNQNKNICGLWWHVKHNKGSPTNLRIKLLGASNSYRVFWKTRGWCIVGNAAVFDDITFKMNFFPNHNIYFFIYTLFAIHVPWTMCQSVTVKTGQLVSMRADSCYGFPVQWKHLTVWVLVNFAPRFNFSFSQSCSTNSYEKMKCSTMSGFMMALTPGVLWRSQQLGFSLVNFKQFEIEEVSCRYQLCALGKEDNTEVKHVALQG